MEDNKVKKYEFTGETKEYEGHTLHRIKALVNVDVWIYNGDEGGSMRGAANALRNQAAAMGGNVIYGVSSPTQGMLSSFVPTASQMNGQVYKCPN